MQSASPPQPKKIARTGGVSFFRFRFQITGCTGGLYASFGFLAGSEKLFLFSLSQHEAGVRERRDKFKRKIADACHAETVRDCRELAAAVSSNARQPSCFSNKRHHQAFTNPARCAKFYLCA